MSVLPTPLANQLLIALPALSDPTFSRSVALICQHDENGAMGVLVNRPSEYTLGEVLSQMGIDTVDEHLREQIVLSGGPVHPERGFVIHDDAREWDSCLEVGQGVFLTTSRDILEAMAAGDGRAMRWWRLAVPAGARGNSSSNWARTAGSPRRRMPMCCSPPRWKIAGRPLPGASAWICSG